MSNKIRIVCNHPKLTPELFWHHYHTCAFEEFKYKRDGIEVVTLEDERSIKSVGTIGPMERRRMVFLSSGVLSETISHRSLKDELFSRATTFVCGKGITIVNYMFLLIPPPCVTTFGGNADRFILEFKTELNYTIPKIHHAGILAIHNSRTNFYKLECALMVTEFIEYCVMHGIV